MTWSIARFSSLEVVCASRISLGNPNLLIALALRAGLLKLGARAGDRVGIMSSNRIEWIVTDLACMMYGLVSVPLIAAEAGFLEKLLELSSCRVIVCARDCTLKLIDLKKKGRLSDLQILVQIEALQYPEMSAVEQLQKTASKSDDSEKTFFLPPSSLLDESLSPAASMLSPSPSLAVKIRLYAFGFVEESGSHSPKEPIASKISDLATIIFTQVVLHRLLHCFIASNTNTPSFFVID